MIMKLTREHILAANDELLNIYIAEYVTKYRFLSHDSPEFLPHYSTDISAAWLVVEKMKENDFWVMVAYPDINDDLETISKWWCKFYPATEELYEEVGAAEFIGIDETAPRAICRAALLAFIE